MLRQAFASLDTKRPLERSNSKPFTTAAAAFAAMLLTGVIDGKLNFVQSELKFYQDDIKPVKEAVERGEPMASGFDSSILGRLFLKMTTK